MTARLETAFEMTELELAHRPQPATEAGGHDGERPTQLDEFGAMYKCYREFVVANLHRLGIDAANVDDAAQDEAWLDDRQSPYTPVAIP